MTDIEKACAKIFSGCASELVIRHLRKITIERVVGPNASESELRTIEGQRALVHQLEQMIQRGKSNAKT